MLNECLLVLNQLAFLGCWLSQALQHGCDPNSARLVELMLGATTPEVARKARRKHRKANAQRRSKGLNKRHVRATASTGQVWTPGLRQTPAQLFDS
eukprot:SAG11_NODE_708_length_7648_cov_3.486687_3_plen_96_part_00